MNEHVIYKYKILITDEFVLNLPLNSKLLSVAEQDGDMVLYAMVIPELGLHPVKIRVIGTGNPMPGDMSEYKFLGTVKTYNGRLMWHIFYKDG
jgi:hypothetical protein